MRLIDADDFKKFIQALCKAGSPYESFIELLDKQTTAYDIGKVVEQLKNRSNEYNSGVRLHGKPEEMLTDEAIEIVKQGGVSDDVCEWTLDGKEANLYLTGCQQRQLIFEGTPKENGYRYCTYCSKKIKVVE